MKQSHAQPGSGAQCGHEAGETLDFANYARGVEGLGPGKRVVLWVRGCPLACPGCMTPELWGQSPASSWVRIEQVAALVGPLLEGMDGLTISGGEPMQQAQALRKLVQLLRVDRPDLEVVVYSGYSLDELRGRGEATQDFLGEIDILIDGRFEQEASNDGKWRGSDNQRIHSLSSRGERHRDEEDTMPFPRPLQIQAISAKEVRIIGIPARGDMERYRQLMEQRGTVVAPKRR